MNPFSRNTLPSRVAKGLILSGLAFIASTTTRAEKVTVTVKGTVVSGGDQYGLFKIGKILKGQDFTLVFTFDDGRLKTFPGGDQCPISSYSTGSGGNPASAATAILTIGNGSFTFGQRPDSTWGVSRNLASFCSKNVIAFNVHEGVYPQVEGIDLRIVPADGQPPLSPNLNWHSPIKQIQFDNDPRYGHFTIVRPRDFQHLTEGTLVVKTVTIQWESGRSP